MQALREAADGIRTHDLLHGVEWHSALHALMGGEQAAFRAAPVACVSRDYGYPALSAGRPRVLALRPGPAGSTGRSSSCSSPSSEILGRTRSRHARSVHARSPSSVITVGATTMRTTSASIRIAAARPRPIVLTTTSGSETKPRKTLVMITPAARMILPTRDIARTTLWAGPAPPMYSSRMRDCRKTL